MANKFPIKGDPSFPHHYLFTVGVKGIRENPGELFMKHGPIYFHHDDLFKMSDAFRRMEDQVFRQTESEALKAEGIYELVMGVLFMSMASQANQCTIHHFSFEEAVSDEYLLSIVDLANNSKDMFEKMKESIVRI
jgi:hypothetical protein